MRLRPSWRRSIRQTDDGQPLRLIHPGLIGDEGDVIRGFLWSVTVLALLVLAAACANLATLFAARAADRSRELALRVALGSSRRRLVRQLLTEAVMVSLMGGAAGLVSADLLLGVLNRWRPPFGGHLAVSVDARVYLAGLALTLGSALLFGMVPARQAWRSSPLQMMKSGPVDTMHLRRFALRDLLLGAQIAICTLLVTASLVAVRGMVRALHAPLGFQPQGAMLVETGPEPGGTGRRRGLLEKEKAMIEAARSIPGVTAVGYGEPHALDRRDAWDSDLPAGDDGVQAEQFGAGAVRVSRCRRDTWRPPARGCSSGRDVSWQDTAKDAVCGDRERNLRAEDVGRNAGDRTALHSVGQPDGSGGRGGGRQIPRPGRVAAACGVSAVVAKRRERSGLRGAVAAGAERDGGGAATHTGRHRAECAHHGARAGPMRLADELFPARAATVALGVMGLLAAMLAVTGIFGMAAYSVSRRMKELGIRVALGARKTQVMSAAVGRPMVLLGVGSVLGLLAGIFASRLLGQIVYQANPRDPVVVGGAVLTMALLGIAASAIPARRALAVDPSKLMREE